MTLDICFAGIVFALSALLLKNFGWRGAPVFGVIASLFLISMLSNYFADIVEIYFSFSGLGDGCAAILKMLGIAYIFGISSDVCRELGEAGISTALTTVGRFEIIAVALPYIKELISLSISLIE